MTMIFVFPTNSKQTNKKKHPECRGFSLILEAGQKNKKGEMITQLLSLLSVTNETDKFLQEIRLWTRC